MGVTIIMALFVGIIYFQLDNSYPSGISNRYRALYFLLYFPGYIMSSDYNVINIIVTCLAYNGDKKKNILTFSVEKLLKISLKCK